MEEVRLTCHAKVEFGGKSWWTKIADIPESLDISLPFLRINYKQIGSEMYYAHDDINELIHIPTPPHMYVGITSGDTFYVVYIKEGKTMFMKSTLPLFIPERAPVEITSIPDGQTELPDISLENDTTLLIKYKDTSGEEQVVHYIFGLKPEPTRPSNEVQVGAQDENQDENQVGAQDAEC